jgi:hypothetical protein
VQGSASRHSPSTGPCAEPVAIVGLHKAGSPPRRFSRTLGFMKIETTVFLSEEILTALGTRAPDPKDRSELVEAALREYLPQLGKRDPSQDLEIINAHAAELNQEAEDVLSYQVIP